ncbi:MAG: hypothetical protein R3B47_12485 [Bacteroidia bacterium]
MAIIAGNFQQAFNLGWWLRHAGQGAVCIHLNVPAVVGNQLDNNKNEQQQQ